MTFLGGYYLVALDGSGWFASSNIQSKSCQTKTNKKTGKVTYYQQVLGAAIVHPDRKEVIPLAPEMVTPPGMAQQKMIVSVMPPNGGSRNSEMIILI